MTEVSSVAHCDVPLEVAFEYLDDYRNVTDYWYGMQSYQPVGELDHGLDSVFEATSKLGPSTVKSTVKTVRWERNALVEYKSVSGLDTATSFVFSAVDESRSTVEFRIEFHLPGGIAGRAMEKTLAPFVHTAVESTARSISVRVAEYYAARQAASGATE
ncbi:SRPBCC family protein [Kitasatospora brasiliensis]|uniref:SRPBCC family protein n=1 Tax=Kitasatospora brasiliensis TaxID=3058040 RepID=UPI00292F166B|nr:SRPBCC family protein [Kitasatospora sp. K002]